MEDLTLALRELSARVTMLEKRLAGDALVPKATDPREKIVELVCEKYALTRAALFGRRGTIDITWPRQVAYYLFHGVLEMSTGAINRYFGKSQNTAHYGIKHVQARMDTDRAVREEVQHLIRFCKRNHIGRLDGTPIPCEDSSGVGSIHLSSLCPNPPPRLPNQAGLSSL